MTRSGLLASWAASWRTSPPTRSTTRSTPCGASSRTRSANPGPDATNLAPVASTPAWKLKSSGLATVWSAFTTTCSAMPPLPIGTRVSTASPTSNSSTPSPNAATTPETSDPRPAGNGIFVPARPDLNFTSKGLTPAARTSTSSSPTPGCGSSRSCSTWFSGPPYWVTTNTLEMTASFLLLGLIGPSLVSGPTRQVRDPRSARKLVAAR